MMRTALSLRKPLGDTNLVCLCRVNHPVREARTETIIHTLVTLINVVIRYQTIEHTVFPPEEQVEGILTTPPETTPI